MLRVTHFLACHASLLAFHRFPHSIRPRIPPRKVAHVTKHADTLLETFSFRWRRHKKRFSLHRSIHHQCTPHPLPSIARPIQWAAHPDRRSDRALTLTWSRYDNASLTLRGRRLLLPPACCCCQVGDGRFGGMLWDMVGGVGAGRGGEGGAGVGERVGNGQPRNGAGGAGGCRANPQRAAVGISSCLSPLLVTSPFSPINLQLHRCPPTQKLAYKHNHTLTYPIYRVYHHKNERNPL